MEWLEKNIDGYRNNAETRSEFILRGVKETGRARSTIREALIEVEKKHSISDKPECVNSAIRSTLESQQKEIDRLQKALNNVNNSNGGNRMEIDVPDNSYTFAIIGDTHIGSLYDRLDNLGNFYKICKSKGVKEVLHTGDILDGHKIYRGQEFEQHKPGWDAQLNRLVAFYPCEDGVKTLFIAGNHDQSYTKLIGMNVGEAIEDKRSDLKFIGNDYGTVIFNTPSGRKFDVAVHHPGGGTAYAISYRLQKIIESLSGGTKPAILGVGHYHKSEMLPEYRNICGIQSGCFQAQTPFMASRGLAAHIGGWIIRFTVGTKLSKQNMIEAQFIAYY
jgi:predicted phosphodiesterase